MNKNSGLVVVGVGSAEDTPPDVTFSELAAVRICSDVVVGEVG